MRARPVTSIIVLPPAIGQQPMTDPLRYGHVADLTQSVYVSIQMENRARNQEKEGDGSRLSYITLLNQ